MNNLNSVLLMGNLTRDPEQNQTTTGKTVTKGSIAVNKVFKTADGDLQEATSFFDIEAWNGNGVQFATMKKGDRVHVVGELRQNRWETDKGEKRSRVIIVATHIEVPSNVPLMV